MNGIEARDYILAQIAANDPTTERSVMKLSVELATDLMKLTPNEIGSFADILLTDGLNGLKSHGLYGYDIDIDINQAGHIVEFS